MKIAILAFASILIVGSVQAQPTALISFCATYSNYGNSMLAMKKDGQSLQSTEDWYTRLAYGPNGEVLRNSAFVEEKMLEAVRAAFKWKGSGNFNTYLYDKCMEGKTP